MRGAPLLSVGQQETRGATCFFVEDGRIVVLRRPDYEEPVHGAVGYVHSQVVSAETPGPTGIRVL